MTEAEFSERVLAMENKLYRVSFSILKNDADCKDATQEAVYKAWRSLNQMREESRFEAWLISILVNKCKNFRRGALRRKTCEIPEHTPAPEVDTTVGDALFSLEEKYRTPIVLYYIAGYGVNEIARILKSRPGTVKSWLHYGREKLRAFCEEVELR